MHTDAHRKSDWALLGVILVWGVNFAILKAALAVMHPHVLNVFRFLVSAVVLGALYAFQQRNTSYGLFAPFREYGLQIVALGLLGYVFYQFFFIVGIDHTTAGSAALIMAGAPLWTASLSHVLKFDRLQRLAWLGLFLTLAGTFIIVVGGTKEIDFSNDTFFGNVMMMGAAALWGAYTAFSKPVSRYVTPTGIAFLGVLIALPFLIGIGLPYMSGVAWSQVGLWVWAAIVFSGGLSTGIAIAVWNMAVKTVGPSQTAVYGNLVPVVALVSGVVLLGETVSFVQVIGGGLIIGGIVLMRRTRRIPIQRQT